AQGRSGEAIDAGAAPEPARTGVEAAPAGRRTGPLGGVPRPGRTALAVLLPLAVVGVMWAVAELVDLMPPPGTDDERLTWLAFAFAGPATSVAVLIAHAWWPRLVGVVFAVGVASGLIVGRALLIG
ncbi:MAG: hypothetical protein ACRDGV_13110, partial [Candidatus Limnocylindria bacterium]